MSGYVHLERQVATLAREYTTDQRILQIMQDHQIGTLQTFNARAAVFNQLVKDILQMTTDHLNGLQDSTLSKRGIAARSFTLLIWGVVSARLESLKLLN